MGDLIAALIKRFGGWLIVVVILVGGGVWLIVHLSTEPGEKVSIFWRMIEYIKKDKSPPEPKPQEPLPSNEKKPPEPTPTPDLKGSIVAPVEIIERAKKKSEKQPQPKMEPERRVPGEEKKSEPVQDFWKWLEEHSEPVPMTPDELSADVRGNITAPPNGSLVARRFQVEGTVLGPYRYLWLVERIGHLHWPKEPMLAPNKEGRWIGEVNEGGSPPEGRFEILLIDVSNSVNERFREWLETGHHSGHYPGLTQMDLGDAKILDRKEYQLQVE